MKNTLYLFAITGLFLFSNPIIAQIEQDKWMVNATTNLSFQSTNFDDSADRSSINFAGTFGYFFKENFALGAKLGVSNAKSGNISSTELKVGPFARYYFNGLFFAGLGYSVNQITRDLDAVQITDTGSQVSVELGYPIWVLIEQLAIEPTLSYDIGMGDLLKGSNSLALNIGFSLYF